MGVLGETAVKITADTSSFHAQASKGILGSVTKIGASAAAIFGGLKLGKSLFVDPIKSAGDFQKSLNVLWASTEHGNKTMKQVSDLAIKLGSDIKLPGVSASDAANAMLQLGKSGFSVSQSMAAVKGSLLLATAAETDGANAAKVVTQNINAFGLQAKDTSVIVDNMAGFMNATGTSFDQFTDSLTYVAAPAHSAGQSFRETAAQLAILSQNGIEGSMAGTGLRQILNGLSTDGSKASKAFKDVGVSTMDAKGQFVGVRGVMEQLQPVMEKMTASDRQKLMKEAFGQTAMNQASILLGTLPSKYDKVNERIAKQGQAQKLAAAQTKGFNGAMANLGNAIEGLQLKIGLKLLPKMTEFVKWLGKIAGAKSFDIAIKIVWKGVVGFAGDLKDAVQKAIFGGRSDELFGTGMVRISAKSIAVDEGIAAKIGAAIAAQNWTQIGTQIGDAIGKAIKVSTDALNGMLDSMMTWVKAHTGQFAEIGIIIGLQIIQKLLDPSFWAQHWQLIGGVILAVATTFFAPAKFAFLGAKMAEGIFSLFGATAGRLLLAALEKLPGRVGEFAPKFAAAFGKMIADAAVLAVAAMARLVAEVLKVVSGGFGKLGPIVRALLSTAIVGVIGNLIAAAVGATQRLMTGIATTVTSALQHLAGSVKSLAASVASAIANGIKTAPAKLAGLAGDLAGKISSVMGQVAGSAFAYARQVGFGIADGVISGIGNLAGRLKDAVVGAAKSAMSWGGKILHGSGDWMFTKQVVGMPMVQGIIDGVTAKQAELNAAITNTVSEAGAAGGRGVDGVTAKMTTIFDAWVTNVKTKVAAGFDAAHAKIDAEFAKAQAKLDAWKAKMTPTEALLASMQAQAALAQVQGAVTAANAALAALDAKFVADWNKLLADQAANMAKLKAVQAVTVTDKDIAGHEFDKTNAATANDPLAQNLLAAQKNLDAMKAAYAAGTATQAELFAAQDAFDTATLNAADDTNAQKLLSDYTTWQNLIKQAEEGAAGIATQEATDETTRAETIAGYSEARKTASQAVYDALTAQQTFFLEGQAKAERISHDARYEELKEALKKRHDKNETHIDNIEKMWDRHFKAIIKQAKEDGKNFTDAYVDAIEDVAKPGGLLETAAGKLATVLKKYLKLNSPAEKGPLSDLDRWWSKLAPTLLSSLDGSAIKAALSDAVTPMSGGFAPSVAGSAERQTVSLNDGALIGKVTELVDVLRKKDAPLGVTVLASGGAQAAVIAARR